MPPKPSALAKVKKAQPGAPAGAERATRSLGGQRATNLPAAQVLPSEKAAAKRKPDFRSSAGDEAGNDRWQQQPSAEAPRRGPPGGGRDSARGPRAGPSGGDGNRNIVVILAKAGLKLGRDGLVDAYDRTISTAPPGAHLAPYRPDIVHQCMLALFDSDLGSSGRLQILIETDKGRTIEVAPNLRPPRTYGRFKGIMERVLKDGIVSDRESGRWLLRTTRWSVAPNIPYGAEVYGVHNAESSPVTSAVQLATGAVADPVPDALQGGMKNVFAFYCISCTDDSNLDGVDYVTKTVCLSKFPATPHVACMRLCEGFRLATSTKTNTAITEGDRGAADRLTNALHQPALGEKRRGD